jgi:hypothetical protein
MSTKDMLVFLVLLLFVQGCSKKDIPDERFIVELPQDATYGTPSMKEGIYTDPIHSFFEVVPPNGFRIDVKQNKLTSKIPNDSPGAGKIVPTSRVYFKTEGAHIGVTVSRTFRTSAEDDVDMKKLKSGDHHGAATVHLARCIMIDNTPGIEIILTIHQGVPYPLISHSVSYVKDGLYHGLTLTANKPEIYLKYQADFIDFLHSYHSIGYQEFN